MRRFVLMRITVCLCVWATAAFGSDIPGWRLWNSRDGFDESNSNNVTIGPSGRLFVNHGDVRHLSILDGYGYHYEEIPFPGPYNAVFEGPTRELWTFGFGHDETKNFCGDGLTGFRRFDETSQKWIHYNIPDFRTVVQSWDILNCPIAPIVENAVLFSVHDCIKMFNWKNGVISEILSATDTKLSTFHSLIFRDTPQCTLGEIITARDGGAWVCGERGVLKLSYQDNNGELIWEHKEYVFPEDSHLQGIQNLIEREDGVLFGSSYSAIHEKDVLVQFDGKSWTVIHSDKQLPVIAGFRDFNNCIWALKDKLYLHRIDASNPEQHGIKMYDAKNMAYESNGIFFISSGQGLLRYSSPAWIAPVGMPEINEPISRIAETPAGSLLFCTNQSIYSFKNGNWSNHIFPENSSFEIYNTDFLACLDEENILIRLNPIGVMAFNPETGEFKQAESPSHLKPFIVYPWSGGKAVITFVDNQTGTFSLQEYDGQRYQIIIPHHIIQEYSKLGWGNPRMIFQTKNGDIWIAHQNIHGPVLYRNGKLRLFREEDGFPGTGSFSILDLGDGRIWCGGRDEICEFDGIAWRSVRTGVDAVRTMIIDKKGRIWAATGSGVHCFDPVKNSWVHYTGEDGLPSSSILKVFEDSQGRIWTGTSMGISVYNPDTDQDPPIAQINPELNSQVVAPGGNAQFVFGGMDKWKYTRSERLLFSQRLDEEEWSPFTTGTIASRSGLPAGNHRFEIKAMDMNWNESEPQQWEFSVLLPWYKEPRFIQQVLFGTMLILFFASYAANRHFRLAQSLKDIQRKDEQLIETNDELQATNEYLNDANTSLHEANEQLRELDKMKTQFVSQASHDLRTPLTAIKGSLDNLLMGIAGALSEKQAKIMTRATTSVDRLTNLINDVLDLNRIETGRIVLEKSDIPFKTLVENIINENQPAAELKQITLNAKLGEEINLYIDGGKIERVVGELISNAIKYTPDNGMVEVGLSCEGDMVSLSVQDSGIGMTKEECAKIWERFYRTSASQKFAKGSGLGLSIAKELVELHEGTLEVASKQDEGTKFQMKLSMGRQNR